MCGAHSRDWMHCACRGVVPLRCHGTDFIEVDASVHERVERIHEFCSPTFREIRMQPHCRRMHPSTESGF